MEKYNELNTITKNYLSGLLCGLSINYETKDQILVTIEYKDSIYRYSYYLEINKDQKKIQRAQHQSTDHGAQMKLDRNVDFETAVLQHLFSK